MWQGRPPHPFVEVWTLKDPVVPFGATELELGAPHRSRREPPAAAPAPRLREGHVVLSMVDHFTGRRKLSELKPLGARERAALASDLD